jgi:hypothetical protein
MKESTRNSNFQHFVESRLGFYGKGLRVQWERRSKPRTANRVASLTPCLNPGRPGKRKTCFFPSKTPPDQNLEPVRASARFFTAGRKIRIYRGQPRPAEKRHSPAVFGRHPEQFGFTGNPLGPGFTDEGVGLFLDGYYGAPPNLIWGQHLPFFEGKFQISNSERRSGALPGFCEGLHAQRLFAQSQGSSPLLQHSRRLPSIGAVRAPAGTVEKVTCWPMPGDPNNENMTIGKLRLSSAEEDDLVAFLETLTDGFVKPSSAAASTPASLTRKPATPPKP